jgi:hypothetical protein
MRTAEPGTPRSSPRRPGPRTPICPATSRRTASSRLSPISTKPANAECRPAARPAMAGQQDVPGLTLGLHGHDHRRLDLREVQPSAGVVAATAGVRPRPTRWRHRRCRKTAGCGASAVARARSQRSPPQRGSAFRRSSGHPRPGQRRPVPPPAQPPSRKGPSQTHRGRRRQAEEHDAIRPRDLQRHRNWRIAGH